MSAFYIGQRVRKVRGILNIGSTGTVFATDNDPSGFTLGVITDDAGVGMFFGVKASPYCSGAKVWGRPDDYEPILPYGLESPAEIAALYEPEDAIA